MRTRRLHPSLPFALLVAPAIAGCSSGTPAVSGPKTTQPPAIVTQPSNLTVPIGLQGTFSVAITGDGTLTEQWYRNGVPIPGANSLQYTTPPVSSAGSVDIYNFSVSNALGVAITQTVVLTPGARAPKDGDLRFRQVDSLNTINGYTGDGFVPSSIGDRGGELLPNAFGTLNLNYNQCSPTPAPVLPCAFFLSPFAQPPGTVPLATGFIANTYSNFETDLSSGYFPGTNLGQGPILAANTVITSLAISTVNNRYALSYTQTSQPGGFDLAQHTVDPSQFQAAATQEGLSSRVITAVAFADNQVFYLSYGWKGDTTTIYETLTATSTFANVGTVASTFGTRGYIITALGGDSTNGIVLVGTRVQGDQLSRPTLVEPLANGSLLLARGYAPVGHVQNLFDPSDPGILIGQR